MARFTYSKILTCFQKGRRGRKAGRMPKTLALEWARAERRGNGERVKVRPFRMLINGRKATVYCVVRI